MTRQKPDFEKLEVSEDFLKSSIISSLGEEGTSVPVEAPNHGTIIGWVKKTGKEVKEGEALCYFRPKHGRGEFIHAPYLRILSLLPPEEAELGPQLIGTLIILVTEGEVFPGTLIAVISPFIKPTKPAEQHLESSPKTRADIRH